jgi:pyrroloquinoline quinone biosynthesis protein D
VNAQARPKFGKGVRLRRERDGSAMLLVPEGALVLNPSAAATLELVDGERSLADIATILVERFEVGEQQAQEDVRELLDRLAQRRLVVEES